MYIHKKGYGVIATLFTFLVLIIVGIIMLLNALLETTHWTNAVCVPSVEWTKARQRWFEQTALPENLDLAGDWTNLDWPSTMEAAAAINN